MELWLENKDLSCSLDQKVGAVFYQMIYWISELGG